MWPDSIAKWEASGNQRPSAAAAALPPDGRAIVIDRPLTEAEWDVVRAFVRRLEREDLFRRFGHPCDFGDEATLRRYFDIDAGVGEIAYVLDKAAAIAGLAHRIMLSQSEAEIALIVRSDLQRTGIGELLMRETLARAARQGLKTLSAFVLWENHAALRLAGKIGYMTRHSSPWALELAFEVARTPAATWLRGTPVK